MSDTTEHFGKSLLQHGKEGNRIYLMKFDTTDEKKLLDHLDDLALKEHYTKIVAKIPSTVKKSFEDYGYELEGLIPSYFDRHQDCVMMGKYLSQDRAKKKNELEINSIITSVQEKVGELPVALPRSCHLRRLIPGDASAIASVYAAVFKSCST